MLTSAVWLVWMLTACIFIGHGEAKRGPECTLSKDTSLFRSTDPRHAEPVVKLGKLITGASVLFSVIFSTWAFKLWPSSYSWSFNSPSLYSFSIPDEKWQIFFYNPFFILVILSQHFSEGHVCSRWCRYQYVLNVQE